MRVVVTILWWSVLSLLVPRAVYSQVPVYDKQEVSLVLLEKAKRVVEMAAEKFIVKAVEAQNSERLTLDVIQARDEEWIKSDSETILNYTFLNSDIGSYLKSSVLRNRAIYSEIFLTDNQGANVSAYPPTSDYWQGDEQKFIVAFNQGKGQLLISPITFDESANTYASQIAAPVYNLEGFAIGVLFIGIKLSYAQAK